MASAAQANDRNKAQERAARLAYLRNARFVTQGFKSNEPAPSLSVARKMAGDNLRLANALRPTPSVSS